MPPNHTNRRHKRKRRGIIYVIAMLFLAILGTLAVSFASAVNMSVRAGGNHRLTVNAQMATESGLSYLCYHVLQTDISSVTDGQTLLDAVAVSLGQTIHTSGMGGRSISYDGTTISIPTISPQGDSTNFSATITLHDASSIAIAVTGLSHQAQRKAGVRLTLQQGQGSSIFDYGMATAGPVTLSGNAKVRGTNSAEEACIYTTCDADTSGVTLGGNSYIEGDVYTVDPNLPVSLNGNSRIAGLKDGQEGLDDHIHKGADEITFPEVDSSEFEPLATNIVSAGTSTSGNKTFTNIRILANTNKTFAGNIKLKGVVFIEQPNQIRFSGNLTVDAVIVTQDAGDNTYETNTLKFTGNTTVRSPQVLPDLPEFEKVKELTGSFLLAPGFGVEFTGNFGTVSGCMAADKFTFKGNAGGTIAGSLINYSDALILMQGNATFYFDRSSSPDVPAGFASSSVKLVVDPTTYSEQ